jgi:hypothetical protein
MKISLIHPSRGRANKSLMNAEEWVLKSGKGVDIEFVLAIDMNDPTKEEYFSAYDNSFLAGEKNHFFADHNTCVVEAANRAAERSSGDILIYLSDDFRCFDNWGQAVIKEFENETRPLLLKVDDCLQKFIARVLTIPIMNRSLYEKLGYFFHPEYKSMWVDCDLFETVYKIGAIKNAEHLKFPHEHHCIGKAPNDDTYRRSEANWNQGKKIFDMRKNLGFPI